MTMYYLNNNAQSNGDHEVHAKGCSFFPTANTSYIGDYSNCQQAVASAKIKFPTKSRINGCYYCSRPCHTS